MGRGAVAAACAVLVVAVGCGGKDKPAPTDQRVVMWVDSDLGAVLRDVRIDGAQLAVTTGSTAGLLEKLDGGGQRPDVLLVQSDTFPTWDESADGLRDSRVVARDPLVLVTRKPQEAPATLAAAAGDPLAYPREGVAGLAVKHALDALPEPPEKEVELPLATDVLAALRDRSADVGVLPRSVLQRADDADQFDSNELLEPGIDIQTAYSSKAPDGKRVVAWLASDEGRQRFEDAGYGPPGSNPRPVDCPADESAPCEGRG